ncbi:uncharacterized protein LOC129226730 [Uloborus diversus]|uniref:uncharacterized protein LOC129226730 n=1 Tax=Uloborus diversus TaxID=327109 RepID=UPI00240A9437|nr:uncharacterized protein LOC129226730 [Uloborus diversus]
MNLLAYWKILVMKRIRYFVVATLLIFIFIYNLKGSRIHIEFKNLMAGDIIDFRYANNITGYKNPIIPNIVHYVQFDSRELNFIQVISIKAVYLHHHPDKIFIHCNCFSLKGKYWNMLQNISIIEIKYMEKPTHIFEKPLSSVYHSSDIARLKILMEYGGIFLDTDTYVVKPLDYYRKFEMSLGWPPGQNLGTQLLIAHKNARFLRLWYNSYRYYRRERWYYNAGELPTSFILERMPYIVHRVPYDFGVHNLVHLLYGTRSADWKSYHSIHLLVRHKNYLLPGDSVLEFDENNIKKYNRTFGDMARLVLFGSCDML